MKTATKIMPTRKQSTESSKCH